jgi:Tfp pilus assembly PilM family ATPase
MGHRVLGIAVGNEAVRVAVIETRLRRFELKLAVEAPRRPAAVAPTWDGDEESPDVPAAAPQAPERTWDLVLRAVMPPPAPTDTVALAYPGDRAFVRRMSLPFKKASQVEAALPFQMIGLVPVAPDEIHCAYEKLPVVGSQGTDVLAVAVPVAEFRQFLDGARADGLEPAHVGVEGPCLQSLLPFTASTAADGSAEVQMLVWAEDDEVEIVVARGQQSILTRAVRLGEPVTQGGDVATSFLREVVLSVASAAEGGASVVRALVAGPDAFVVAGPLGEALGLPCDVLDPARLPIPGAATCPGLSPSMVKALALALGTASGGGPGSLNLRSGAFATEGNRSIIRERATYFTIALAVFLVLGAARGVARYVGLKAERDAGIAELKVFSKEVLGAEKDNFDTVLKTLKSVSEEDVKVFPRWTAVGTLHRIAKVMMDVGHAKGVSPVPVAGDDIAGTPPPAPADGAWALELENVRIEARQATVRGEAETIETLDQFVAKLNADSCISDVVSESTERIQFQRHQGWQRFTLRMAVDCNPKEVAPKKAKEAGAGATGKDTDKEEAAPAK